MIIAKAGLFGGQELVQEAESAQDAARAARIRLATTPEEAERAARLLTATGWAVSASDMWDLVRSGCYVGVSALAGDVGGEVIGAAVGWLTVEPGHRPTLWSARVAVDPAFRGRRIARMLKQHQRAWAEDAGLPVVRWDLDPVRRDQLWLAAAHLGVDLAVGPGGLEARWVLASARAQAARLATQTARALRDDVDVLLRDGQQPRVRPLPSPDDVGYGRLVCALPIAAVGDLPEGHALRTAWAEALDATLLAAIEAGWALDGITEDAELLLVPPAG